MTLTPSPITNVVKFVECCTGTEIFFRGSLPIVNGTTYLYIGLTPFPGTGGTVMPGACYTLYNLYIPDIFYPPAPSIVDLEVTKVGLDCNDPKCPSCDPPVKLPCYMVIPCDGTDPVVSNNIAFASLVGTFVNVITSTYSGCAYIAELTGNNCENAVDVAVDLPCPPCELRCYFIDNSNGVLYVDADNVLQEISLLDAKPYVKICSRVYPVVDTSSHDYLIVDLGPCDEDGCPQKCYKLTNCETLQVIYTNSDSVLPYLYSPNSTVKILGKEGCWVVSNLADKEICDCPIDVTIVSSYIDCQTCIGYTSYKLTSCEGNDVIYTLDDLSAYLNDTIKIHCGCYTIEELTILPPNVQTVTVDYVFKSCTECLRTYWKLTDCANLVSDVYTYTDLSLYEGKVIKIEGCDTCWSVEATTEPINATTVTVVLNFVDCIECAIDLPCQCSKMTNVSSGPRNYVYLDCEYNLVEITLQAGESTDKLCAIQWYAKGYCSCFLVKFTIEINIDQFTSVVYAANANGQELNGYPVYTVCTGDGGCGTVSFNGTNWIFYDPNGVEIYMLTNLTSTSCPLGSWGLPNGTPIPNMTLLSYDGCNLDCSCIDLTITVAGISRVTNFTIIGYDESGNAIYQDEFGNYTIKYNTLTGCWEMYIGASKFPEITICGELDCPVGTWSTVNPTTNTYISTNCTKPSVNPDLLFTDFLEYFGLCKQGVCPQPVFVNNRTVRPGYNTPICSPEKYDAITCRFADAMYRLVLEKRYGITNCCAEDNENAIVQKELIDLQALKDPNYNCPDCPCSCNSGKTCSTCNCGNKFVYYK